MARVVQRLRGDAERVPEPVAHVLRVREHPLGLAQGDAVGFPDHVAHVRAVVLALQVGVVGVVPQLVRRAVLVDQPHDLALVLGEVGGELQSDHRIDLQAVALGDVEAAPHRHLVGELARRVPLAGDLDEVGLVTRVAQGPDQGLGVRLRAAAHERGLRVQDRDPHSAGLPRGGVPSLGLKSVHLRLEHHDLLGEAGGELGVVGEQTVVAPGRRAHQAPDAALELPAPLRRRREVALPHRDQDGLVGTHLRRRSRAGGRGSPGCPCAHGPRSRGPSTSRARGRERPRSHRRRKARTRRRGCPASSAPSVAPACGRTVVGGTELPAPRSARHSALNS